MYPLAFIASLTVTSGYKFSAARHASTLRSSIMNDRRCPAALTRDLPFLSPKVVVVMCVRLLFILRELLYGYIQEKNFLSRVIMNLRMGGLPFDLV